MARWKLLQNQLDYILLPNALSHSHDIVSTVTCHGRIVQIICEFSMNISEEMCPKLKSYDVNFYFDISTVLHIFLYYKFSLFQKQTAIYGHCLFDYHLFQKQTAIWYLFIWLSRVIYLDHAVFWARLFVWVLFSKWLLCHYLFKQVICKFILFLSYIYICVIYCNFANG